MQLEIITVIMLRALTASQADSLEKKRTTLGEKPFDYTGLKLKTLFGVHKMYSRLASQVRLSTANFLVTRIMSEKFNCDENPLQSAKLFFLHITARS